MGGNRHISAALCWKEEDTLCIFVVGWNFESSISGYFVNRVATSRLFCHSGYISCEVKETDHVILIYIINRHSTYYV